MAVGSQQRQECSNGLQEAGRQQRRAELGDDDSVDDGDASAAVNKSHGGDGGRSF